MLVDEVAATDESAARPQTEKRRVCDLVEGGALDAWRTCCAGPELQRRICAEGILRRGAIR